MHNKSYAAEIAHNVSSRNRAVILERYALCSSLSSAYLTCLTAPRSLVSRSPTPLPAFARRSKIVAYLLPAFTTRHVFLLCLIIMPGVCDYAPHAYMSETEFLSTSHQHGQLHGESIWVSTLSFTSTCWSFGSHRESVRVHERMIESWTAVIRQTYDTTCGEDTFPDLCRTPGPRDSPPSIPAHRQLDLERLHSTILPRLHYHRQSRHLLRWV